MNDLREHPQITELIETLNNNGMQKEKEQVMSLVNYIDDMEKSLGEMLNEMKGMHEEINMIHNSSLRNKCRVLVNNTEEKIKKAFYVIKTVKDNFVKAAANAIKEFKEKGNEALKGAVRTMKIPESLDRLSNLFGKLSKEIKQDATQLNSMQKEVNKAKFHLKNVGRLLKGKSLEKANRVNSDKGILGRLGGLFSRISSGFAGLSKRAMDLADNVRVSIVESSVKNDLKMLSGIKNPANIPAKSFER